MAAIADVSNGSFCETKVGRLALKPPYFEFCLIRIFPDIHIAAHGIYPDIAGTVTADVAAV